MINDISMRPVKYHPTGMKQLVHTPYGMNNGFMGLSNSADDDSGNFLSDLTGIDFGKLSDTINTVVSAIKGREYTIGKYKLAEKYLRYVLGADIDQWEDVPDDKVNEAIDFFSKAFKIPITTIEDLDNLDPQYNPGGTNVQDYVERDPLYSQVPVQDIQRAVAIKRLLPYSLPRWDFLNVYRQLGIPVGTADTAVTNASPTAGYNPIPNTGSAQPTYNKNTFLYVGLGILGLIVIILVVVMIAKKK